jgi:hypothetical protein
VKTFVGVISVDDIIDGIAADLSGLSGVMKISRGAEAGSVLPAV